MSVYPDQEIADYMISLGYKNLTQVEIICKALFIQG